MSENPWAVVAKGSGQGIETDRKDLRYWTGKIMIKQLALLCTKEEKPSF